MFPEVIQGHMENLLCIWAKIKNEIYKLTVLESSTDILNLYV